MSRPPVTGVQGTDQIPIADDSDNDNNKKVNVSVLLAYASGISNGGIANNSNGQFYVRASEFSSITSIQGADRVLLDDDSAGNNAAARGFTITNLVSYMQDQIPAGETGPQGDTGPAGPTGAYRTCWLQTEPTQRILMN